MNHEDRRMNRPYRFLPPLLVVLLAPIGAGEMSISQNITVAAGLDLTG
jgi:hypothetical protein